MANQGKSDLLMVDGFLNICTENIITEPNANQSSESGSNTNQSVDFDKDNDNLNVSNEETEMPSDNIEGSVIQLIDTNQFVESDNNKNMEGNNEISDKNGFNLMPSAAGNKSSKQKMIRYSKRSYKEY